MSGYLQLKQLIGLNSHQINIYKQSPD